MHVCWANDKAHVSTLTGGKGRLLKSRCIAFRHTWHSYSHGFRTYSPAILYHMQLCHRDFKYSALMDTVWLMMEGMPMWVLWSTWVTCGRYTDCTTSIIHHFSVTDLSCLGSGSGWIQSLSQEHPVHHRAACSYTPPGNAQNYIKTITWHQNQ